MSFNWLLYCWNFEAVSTIRLPNCITSLAANAMTKAPAALVAAPSFLLRLSIPRSNGWVLLTPSNIICSLIGTFVPLGLKTQISQPAFKFNLGHSQNITHTHV
jgi:hypothetical protein